MASDKARKELAAKAELEAQGKLVCYDNYERASLFFGALTLVLIGPPVGVVVGSTVLWEAIDRGFKGGLVESNNELSGFIFGRLIPWFERLTKPFNEKLVKHPDDAYLVNLALYFCLGLPLLLKTFGRLHLAAESTGAALLYCYAYHVLRIGPFFMNFACRAAAGLKPTAAAHQQAARAVRSADGCRSEML